MGERPEKPTNDYGLTDSDWRFVNEYVIDFSPSKAAKRAGMTEATAKRAYLLTRRPEIRKAINDLLEERSALWECTHARVIQEAMSIAFSNIKDFVKWDNQGVRLVPSDKLSRAIAAGILEVKQIDTKDGRQIKIKRETKTKAIELLMRNLGILDPVGGEESNRGIFAKWAEEQRLMALEETEREQLRHQIAELREQLAKLQKERGERNVEAETESGGNRE